MLLVSQETAGRVSGSPHTPPIHCMVKPSNVWGNGVTVHSFTTVCISALTIHHVIQIIYIYLHDNKVAANAVFATDGAATDPNE